MLLALNFSTMAFAVGLLRGSGPKVNSVPSPAGPVMETIKANAWDTVIGKMEFDAKGDIKQIDYVVYKWDAKGGYTEVNPKGS